MLQSAQKWLEPSFTAVTGVRIPLGTPNQFRALRTLKLTPAAKRKYMECECPLWIYGNTETTHVPRQSTGTNIIAAAEAQRQEALKERDEILAQLDAVICSVRRP